MVVGVEGEAGILGEAQRGCKKRRTPGEFDGKVMEDRDGRVGGRGRRLAEGSEKAQRDEEMGGQSREGGRTVDKDRDAAAHIQAPPTARHRPSIHPAIDGLATATAKKGRARSKAAAEKRGRDANPKPPPKFYIYDLYTWILKPYEERSPEHPENPSGYILDLRSRPFPPTTMHALDTLAGGSWRLITRSSIAVPCNYGSTDTRWLSSSQTTGPHGRTVERECEETHTPRAYTCTREGGSRGEENGQGALQDETAYPAATTDIQWERHGRMHARVEGADICDLHRESHE
ncbi:hypothetical protein KM043_015513 [Ampulex compressa]|nr:hypothetical protein KM043_015513 [Ampulex compressa]